MGAAVGPSNDAPEERSLTRMRNIPHTDGMTNAPTTFVEAQDLSTRDTVVGWDGIERKITRVEYVIGGSQNNTYAVTFGDEGTRWYPREMQVQVKVRKMTPQEKRMIALGRVSHAFGGLLDEEMAPLVDDILKAIDGLYRFGKTEKWARALDNWKVMVERDRERPRWAFVQFLIYANHAV